jgi:nucleoid DNA-binding protein
MAVAKKAAKKVAKKAPVKVAKKTTKKVAAKVAKAPVKKIAKKVTKKTAAKKTAKKVTAKAPVKAAKVAKKAAKKIAKKAPAAKIVKKAKCGCCEHAVTKKAPAKVAKPAAKTAAKPVAAKKSAVVRDANKVLNKTQLIAIISEQVDLEKKKVSAVLDTITDIIAKELKKPGLFQIPGLVKIEKKTIPAQKAIKDWKNPFTGEIGTKPAKPASTKVKVRALKKLKDMA